MPACGVAKRGHDDILSFEEILRTVKAQGYTGIELVASQMVPGYPYPSDEWLAQLKALLEEIGPNHAVRLVTGDGLIQLAAVGAGVLRTSSREFEKECREVFRRMDDLLRQRQRALPNRLRLPEDEKKEE